MKVTRLDQPVIISEFWKNRGGETVRIQLREYEGAALIDVRVHYIDKDGKLAPTPKGLSCSVRKLPDLVKGLTKAMERAIDIGLLAANDTSDD
jgi:Transcriptional Coactivator p15 (PC4)